MTFLDELFKELSDGICVSDADGNILYLNPAGRRMLDLPEDGPMDGNLCRILCGRLETPSSKECASHCPLRDAGCPDRSVTFNGKHGPKIAFEWKDVSCRRVERWKNFRVHCLRMPTSLFEPWETEKHFTIFEDASTELELERRKEDWRNMIAHDLRTPLTSIYGALKSLEDVPPGRALEPRELQMLKIGLRNCQRMTEALDLFMDVARLDAASMPIRPEALNLRELVRKCAEDQAFAAQSGRVEVSVGVPEGLSIQADPSLAYRVVENILANALKFTPVGGRVVIGAKKDGDMIALSIKDSGPGIAAGELPFIFDRFYQARASREGKLKGSGLGLTFCREAVKAMSGTIHVDSEPGAGSDFVVRLPAAVGAAIGG